MSDERDAQGRTHYDRVREYYRTHEVGRLRRVAATTTAADRLTPLFYKGDRSMRESGFDPSERFGALERRRHPLRAGVPQHAALPDGAGRGADPGARSASPDAARTWRERARRRAARRSTATCGTRRRGSTSTTTSRRSAAGRTSSRRPSTRSGSGAASPEQARARARQPGSLRGAGRHPHQHPRHRAPVGRAVRLGAAADDRGRGAAPLRVRRGRRPRRAQVPRARDEGVRGARRRSSRSTTSGGASRTCRRTSASATARTRSASAGRTARTSSCWRDCARLADEPHGRVTGRVGEVRFAAGRSVAR